jgi:transcriptional regulator with XRE-family HTH domain
MDLISFGGMIRYRREEEGWSQEELAQKVNLSRNYLSQIERGVATNISWQIVERLVSVLGLSFPQTIDEQRGQTKLPAGLREFAAQANLPDGDVEMLAQIRYRGKQPSTPKEWEMLYKAIKIAMEET